MAINTTTRQTTAFTSGQTFAFAFKVYEEGDVKVIRITNSTGAEEVLTITTHYTVTLNDDQNANPGGSITLVSSGSPVNLGSGFSIVITSKVTPLQQTEITNQGGFFPEVINDVLDKAAILDQQQQSILDKTIRFPLTQTVGGLEITENAANRAGKVVQFDGSGDLTILGTVDGRDVSADGAKLDTIETNAKDDQTAAEIRALVESASDSNVFTDADHSKLNGIEAGATGDLNASEVKALYEGNSNTNAFTDALVSKLNGIEAGATGDQSASEIRTLVESASDSNVFTDNDHSKLDGIETGATADQTSGEIKTLFQSDKLTANELANNSVTVSQIQDSQITAAKLDPAAVITASEQASATPNDTSFLTSAAADARFFNVSTGDTIKDGDTFPDNDTTIATTAAINDRIIDLVDDVGGFVPIANETSFPTANPDAENGTGTVVSVKAASTNLTPSGTTVTIANGAGTGNTVTITGVPSVIPSGFGFIVETTSTTHTYTFHRLVPKATEVTTVAGKAVEIGRLGTADAVADMAILGTTDVVADLNMLATTDIVADMALLATTDVIADMALLAVPDVISDMNLLATSDNITAMDTCRDNISSITNASSNISSINNFGDKYQIAANDPSTDGGGNALAAGDLYFNTSANELKVYNGSSWQGGVTASGSFASTTGNTFTGDNRYNDNVKLKLGTGSDLEIFHDGSNSFIKDTGTGILVVTTNQIQINNAANGENIIKGFENGGVELFYDHSKKLETTSSGVAITGELSATDGLVSGTQIVAGNPALRFRTLSNSLANASSIEFYYNTSNLSARIRGKARNGSNGQIYLDVEDGGTLTNIVYVHDDGLDMTQGHIDIPNDTYKLRLGASADLQIYHDGSHSYIKDAGTGSIITASDSWIYWMNAAANETIIKGGANAQVELYYDNSKKLETTSAGVTITGHLTVGTATLYSTGNFLLGDNDEIRFGNGEDLKIYHDGSNSFIQDSGTGDLFVRTTAFKIQGSNSDDMIAATQSGAVELYHNNNKKLETTSTGIDVTGRITTDSITIQDDGSNEPLLHLRADDGSPWAFLISNDNYHSGTTQGLKWYVANNGNAFQLLQGNGTWEEFSIQQANGGGSVNTGFKLNSSRAVELNYQGSKKFETTSAGATITGSLTTGGFTSTTAGDALFTGTTSGRNAKWDTSHNRLIFDDNALAVFGSGADLQIYHDGNNKIEAANGYLRVAATTNILYLDGNNTHIRSGDGGEIQAKFIDNGAVELRYDNSSKFETTSTGSKVTANNDLRFETGNWTGEGTKIQHHNNNLYIQGTTHYFRHSGGTNRWIIGSDGHLDPATDSTYDIGESGKRVRNIYADNYYGDGSNLTGISAGAQGGGNDEIFWCNGQTVTTNYTIPNGKNAMSAGPITIANNVTVTIGSGETWTVV